MKKPELSELVQILRDLENNPPPYEQNDVVPELIRIYLAQYPTGLEVIEKSALGLQPNGYSNTYICDVVEALGVIADNSSGPARLKVLQNILRFAPTAPVRDSALLGLLSFDSPDLYEILHSAVQKEPNKVLRADIELAMHELKRSEG